MAARYKSMPTGPLSVVIQHVLAEFGPDGGGITDGELLARFLSSRDDNALAALVRRHARMVWGVCCRLLYNHHDAEDAFQATFLVLVRKAAGVPGHAVANWLYGVARQTAVRLRATAAKRGRRETQVINMPEPTVAEVREAHWQSVLDEELGRLPGHYRGVIVLCDLEDRTRKEAARQLGIPEGSVASRLTRARVLLAKRLTRRGIVFSGGSLAAVLSAQSASASAPPALVASTIKAASLCAAGKAAAATGVISAQVAALTEGMVQTMFATKIKSVLAVVVLIAALAGGAAGLIYQTQAAEQPQAKVEPNGQAGRTRDAVALPVQPKPPAEIDKERLVGWWTVVNDDSNRKGEVWEIGTHQIVKNPMLTGIITQSYFHRLDATKSPKQIDIAVTSTGGMIGAEIPMTARNRPIGVIKGIYELNGDELRVCLGLGKDRPTAFAGNPKPGELLVLRGPPHLKVNNGALTKAEKLRMLIDNVLAAHGGEDKLNKLQFTMTVKVDNGITDDYFVQPPKHFRWESQHRDSTTRQICILLPHGREFWTKDPPPDGKTRPLRFGGAELRMEYHLDRVKFFGPRQVLRLKDADHRVTLLDEEVKIEGRPAVGVEVTRSAPNLKLRMYFDKETHLLVRQGETYYCEYKKMDGIPIARMEKHPHAGTGAWQADITDFRAVEEFDPKLFEQP
jgi:RNA polymerase sigma factor (sigma-70 family)